MPPPTETVADTSQKLEQDAIIDPIAWADDTVISVVLNYECTNLNPQVYSKQRWVMCLRLARLFPKESVRSIMNSDAVRSVKASKRMMGQAKQYWEKRSRQERAQQDK